MKRQYGVCSQLAKDKPELADEFRKGSSYHGLAGKHLPELYQENPKAATSRAMHAVRYLMKERERERCAREHVIANEETFCRQVYKDKRGIWASYNIERLQKAREKGGKIGGLKTGRKNYKAGKGIASLTHEQLVAQGKRAALNRGMAIFEGEERNTPYRKINEKDFILSCAILEEYTWEEICRQANQIYHNNRTSEAINHAFNNHWKPQLLEQLAEEGIPVPDSLVRKKYRLSV